MRPPLALTRISNSYQHTIWEIANFQNYDDDRQAAAKRARARARANTGIYS